MLYNALSMSDSRLVKDPNNKKNLFFIKANDEQVYSGFPLVNETETDGFVYGAITNYLDADEPDGCLTGDGFVQAPDTSRAGLVWQVGINEEIETLIPPDDDRWGVYAVNFSLPVKTMEDLIYNFRRVLPQLKEKYQESLMDTK